MSLRRLILLAGAVLPGLAKMPLPPDGPDVQTNRTSLPGNDSSSKAPPHRRLQQQLHLTDASGAKPRAHVAYAALMINDHDRGIRTLGQSLIDSRTAADLVAILGEGVSKAAEGRLRDQGWRIRRLSTSGAAGGDERLDLESGTGSVLAYASAWSLVEYKRVILLADSMLVVENIDDLFQCPGICAAMEQAEVLSTSLIVLEPDLETHRDMSQAAGKIFSFSDDFQGFLNSYLAGFEACALFDLENPALQELSTDPGRGPDGELLDHTCHRLPTRYNGDLKLVMLNGGLGMVRTKNAMPEEWWRQRRARVVRFEFAGLRPWMWFASPLLPFVSAWESAHLRAKPGDATPSLFWAMLVWVSFVGAALMAARTLLTLSFSYSSRSSKGETRPKGAGDSWLARVPRFLAWKLKRRGSSASSHDPRGLLWSFVHLTVGFSSLALAVAVGVARVPAASTVTVSWMIFITWTSTVFGMLWSLYLWLASRPSQWLPARSIATGGGDGSFASSSGRGSAYGNSIRHNSNFGGILTPPSVGGPSGGSIDPLRVRAAAEVGGSGGACCAGISVASAKDGGHFCSPWRESVSSLALFAAALAFLPAWKPLSGSASLATLLGPAFMVVTAAVVGLTVQMIRLPVLWCDRVRFLSLVEGQLEPCRNCGRVE